MGTSATRARAARLAVAVTAALAAAILVSAGAGCGDNRAPDPCEVTACALPAPPHCDGDTVVVTHDAVCSSNGGVEQCSYATDRIECTKVGQVCREGACHAPACASVTCDTPPADTCAAAVATVHDATGTCSAVGDVTTCSYPSHTVDCAAAHQGCKDGACFDPCVGVTCDAPPAPTCSGQVATTYAATGTCDGTGGTAQCVYAPTFVDCAEQGQVCSSGACMNAADPCVGVTCTTPPTDTCSGETAVRYPATGTCSSASGSAQCVYAPTSTDCAAQNQVCHAGACTDPCTGVTCTTPPAPSCAGFVLTTYPATGTCAAPGGVPACSYAPITTSCAATNQACSGGACVDPCASFTCTTPPANGCTGDTLHVYPATGACTSPAGVPGCTYAPTDTDCAAGGQICVAAACRAPLAIGFCRVQFPDSITDVAGAMEAVYGRVYVAGLTDQSGVDDLDPRLVAQLGWGTAADPSTWTTWTAAAPNLGYGPASAGYEANNDEYQGTLVMPGPAGTTASYEIRFSGDAGRTWTYCQIGNGGNGGPGTLTVSAGFRAGAWWRPWVTSPRGGRGGRAN